MSRAKYDDTAPFLDVVDRFRLFYRANYWGDSESVSGDSSRVGRAKLVSWLLSSLTSEHDTVLLDLGCGDCNWISEVDLHDTKYIGIDIVPELIEQNAALESGHLRSFQCLDICSDMLPNAEIIIARDVFTHLTDAEVVRVLRSIQEVGPTLLIASTFRGAVGDRSEVAISISYSSIDLEAEPYGLGRATWFVPEPPATVISGEQRGLGIWSSNNSLPLEDTMRRLIDQIPATIQLKNVRPGRFIDGASKAKVCVDGRGFAFISPVDQFSSRVDRNSVRIAPAYVPVGAVERRLTKKRDLHRSQLVLGHSCVATIEDPNGHRGFDAGDLCLVPPSFEAGSDVVGPGVSGVDGYLRSSVEIDIQKITPLPGLGQPHLWLLAIPLSIVVSASDLIDELEGDLEKLHACIWGAGTLGMLFGWYLRRLGWAVSIADIYPMNSLVARSVEQLGAAYVGPEFDWIPEEVAPLGISVTTEISKRESRRKSIDQLLISVAEMDSRCRRLVVHRSGGLRFAKMPAVSHDHIPEAVRTIATNSEFPWGDLVSGIDPLSRYDAAIFPATPSRLRIVAVQS